MLLGQALSEGNLDDFVDVRVLVEVECARRAAANRTDALIAQLEASLKDMMAEPMNHDAFMDSDTRFHLASPIPPRTRFSKTSDLQSSRSSGSGILRPIISRKPKA